MKLMTPVVIGLSFLLLLIGCDETNPTDKHIVDFSLLNDNEFIHEIDRISRMPDVQFPSDNLQEDDLAGRH